jgi:hypothetical protein
VIAEEAADADKPDGPGLDQRGEATASCRVNETAAAADRESQSRKFEGRDFAGSGGHQSER